MKTIRTGCKINLYLSVGERLPNGYHTLETFFLPLQEPHDVLHISIQSPEAPFSGLNVSCASTCLNPHQNTLTKAYTAYAEHTGFAPAMQVTLEKHVPAGAGLGGGSANAAGVLRFLEETRTAEGGTPLQQQEMIRLGATVGADVPVFLLNSPATASGIGDILSPATNPFMGYTLVLVCPNIPVSTPWAFAALDAKREKKELSKKNCLTYSWGQDISSFAREVQLRNDFEEVVFETCPELSVIKQNLLEKGAAHALMSGTGSSLYGFYKTEEQARKAAQSTALQPHSVFMQTV